MKLLAKGTKMQRRRNKKKGKEYVMAFQARMVMHRM